MPRTLLASAALAAAVLFVAAPLPAATSATVHGVEAVNVRRGPSAESPSFAMLRRGARVSVESITGSWALVELASGQKGYIHAAYLALPAGADVPTVGLEPTAAAETPGQTATPDAAAAGATSEPGQTPQAPAVEARLEQALDRIRALESALVTPSPAAEVRLADATPVPLGFDTSPPGDDFSDLREIAPALALAGVGFLAGFVLGAAYGQRQERNRRSRVRF
jgi:uncharacterized protein YraI